MACLSSLFWSAACQPKDHNPVDCFWGQHRQDGSQLAGLHEHLDELVATWQLEQSLVQVQQHDW